MYGGLKVKENIRLFLRKYLWGKTYRRSYNGSRSYLYNDFIGYLGVLGVVICFLNRMCSFYNFF